MSSSPITVALIVPTAEELILLQTLRAQTAAKVIPVKAAVVNRGPVSNTIFNPIEDHKTKLAAIEVSKAVKARELLKAKPFDIHFFRKTKVAARLVIHYLHV